MTKRTTQTKRKTYKSRKLKTKKSRFFSTPAVLSLLGFLILIGIVVPLALATNQSTTSTPVVDKDGNIIGHVENKVVVTAKNLPEPLTVTSKTPIKKGKPAGFKPDDCFMYHPYLAPTKEALNPKKADEQVGYECLVYFKKKLTELGLASPAVTLDGKYDDKLKQTVSNFQQKHKDGFGRPLRVNGVIGVETWSALRRLVDPPQSPTHKEDTANPSAPANMKSSFGWDPFNGYNIDTKWQPSTDDTTIKEYDVYKNDKLLATQTKAKVTDKSLPAKNASYTYKVRARDTSGKVSDYSQQTVDVKCTWILCGGSSKTTATSK